MARRHLNQEQRLKMIKDELTENPKKSDRQVAKDLGVANSTVSRNREKLVEKGEVLQCHTSTGKDGKEYPRQGQRADLANEGQESLLGGLSVNLPEVPKGKTTELAAEKAGFGSDKTYREASGITGRSKH